MSISFTKLANIGCENVYIFFDKESSLKAIIVLHSTILGPAIGGCRMISYSSEEEALNDVVKLAKNMTYKCALAKVNYGGGKSVILAPEHTYNRGCLFRTFGQFINKLNGQYITAIDSGTSMADMEIIAQETLFVTGYEGQADCFFNPSYFTAKGILESMSACANFRYQDSNLQGKKIFIKGVGSVGSYIASFLKDKGAQVYVTDIDPKKIEKCIKEIGVTGVLPQEMYTLDYNIFCPCDTEHSITEENVGNINADIVVGATNNQLSHDSLAKTLFEKGILYCPDYVANSGGLIYVANLYEKKPLDDLNNKIHKIYDTTKTVLDFSLRNRIPTKEAADTLAQKEVNKIKINPKKSFSKNN